MFGSGFRGCRQVVAKQAASWVMRGFIITAANIVFVDMGPQ
jgi:hypothetical protein